MYNFLTENFCILFSLTYILFSFFIFAWNWDDPVISVTSGQKILFVLLANYKMFL